MSALLAFALGVLIGVVTTLVAGLYVVGLVAVGLANVGRQAQRPAAPTSVPEAPLQPRTYPTRMVVES